MEKIQVNNVSNININNLAILSTSTGAALQMSGTGVNISLNANDISATLGGCIEASNVTSVTITNNTLNSCTYALSGSNV